MSNYRCPKCGQDKEFYANNFIEWYTVKVDSKGDFVCHESCDATEYSEQSEMWCAECEHVGKWSDFEVKKADEYKVCMYLQFVSGKDPDTYYPGQDKLWFEILLEKYRNGYFTGTIDCNGFELPLSFMALSAGEREAMREELMDKAAVSIAEMLERNGVEQYEFDMDGGLVDLQSISTLL